MILNTHDPGTILTSYPSFCCDCGLPQVTVETGFRHGHTGKKRQRMHFSYNHSCWTTRHYGSRSDGC